MWHRLPLNVQLIVALLLVQASAVGVGVLWLIHRTESSRLHDLYGRMDSQADLVEDLVKEIDGRFSFEDATETGRELRTDAHIYFGLTDSDGTLVAASIGPSVTVRAALNKVIASRAVPVETPTLLLAGSEYWLIQSEEVTRPLQAANPLQGHVHVAIYAQGMLDENMSLRRYMSIAAMVMLLVSSLGTWFVVSRATRNIRNFAHQLRTRDDKNLDIDPSLTPLSAEARLLFDNHAELIASIKKGRDAQRLFIAHASHELKTPIAAAMAALEVTLSRPRSSKDYEQTCRDVFGEVKVLNRLASLLLDLARLEEGGDIGSSCALSDIGLQIVERWERSAADQGVRLVLNLSPQNRGRVPGRLEHWEVILGNLVDNAIKYGQHGGSVSLDFDSDGQDHPVVVVRDDGRGMNETERSRLGEIFFRADESRTATGSFGLGFAHAQRVAKSLGYEIVVTSDLGTGTTAAVRPQSETT